MSAAEILDGTIRPVLSWLWTEARIANGPSAEAMMVAIGLQESRFEHRDQVNTGPAVVGPATGFWQFEKGGGVAGVMGHHLTADLARKVAHAAGVAWDRDAIWRAFTLPDGDQLATAFARLLLYTDPRALPAADLSSEDAAWDYYLRNWRPGKPHRETWGAFWRQGVALASAGGQGGAMAPAVPPGAMLADGLESRVAALEAKMARLAAAVAG